MNSSRALAATLAVCLGAAGILLTGQGHVPAVRASQPAALLLVANPSNPTAGEAALQRRLEALEYAVQLREGALFEATDAAVASLVVIAPGAELSDRRLDELGPLPIPIVSLRLAAVSGLGLSAEQDLAVAAQQGDVRVADSLHPLAAGFYGKLALDDGPVDLPAVRSNGRGKSILSLSGSSDRSFVIAYESGDKTARGSAAARRVVLLLPEVLLAGGRRAARDMFTAAVHWATGTNAPPWVFAGPAITTSVARWTLLPGRASDDGLPGEAPVLSRWTVVSGPAEVEFQDDTATLTHARFAAPGEYVLRLTSFDGSAAGSDSVSVSVVPQQEGTGAGHLQASPLEPEGTLTVTGDVLLVVGNPASLTAGDAAMKARVEAIGFSTTLAAPDASVTEANGRVGLVISATAGNTANQFSEVSVPIMVMSAGLCDDYYVCDTTNRGNVSGATLAIYDSAHPMAAGLEGNVIVSSVSGNIAWGGVTQAAKRIATVPGDSTHAVVAAYDTGDRMYQRVDAPNRRVMFGVSTDPGIENLTADGDALLESALLWMTHNNLPPRPDAGADFNALFPGATVSGEVTDDGQPAPSAIVVTWSVVSAPGGHTADFGTETCAGTATAPPACLATSVTFSGAGQYELRLTASDGEWSRFDDVVVTVVQQNAAPVVDAGPPKSTTHPPGTVTLIGTASDDGLPAPPALTYSWTKLSGPGGATFSPANALTTTATFDSVGTYVVRLTVSDGDLSGYNETTVTVGGTALLVVNNASALTADDNLMLQRIQAAGLVVTTRTASAIVDAAQAQTESAGRKLVLLGPSCSTADIVAKYTNVTVPVIATGTGYIQSMNMTTAANRGTATTATVSMFGGLHPMTMGLSGDVQAIYASTLIGWGKPSASGTKIAVVPGQNTQAPIFAYEKNASMAGLTAPDRRVAFLLWGWANLTPAGRSLLDGAIRWAGRINMPPFVDAGPARQVVLPATASLAWQVGDDGKATATPAFSWSVVSGPPGGSVNFTNPNTTPTTASFSDPGNYVLRLTAYDGEFTVYDDVSVVAAASSPSGNLPPVVSAGPDRLVVLPGTLTLTGQALDDGQPSPLTLAWSKLSGPGTATFGTPASATTTLTVSEPGSYVLRLTANDGLAWVYDEVAVQAQGSALLVVADAAALTATDLAIKARLEALGHFVGVLSDDSAAASTATGTSIVVISPGCAPSLVAGKYKAVTVPVITMQSSLFDDNWLTNTTASNFGDATSQTEILMTNPAHPIAGGLTGLAPMTSGAATYSWGKPTSPAAPAWVASLSSDSAKRVIFTYDQGAILVNGGAAAQRRVAFGMAGNSMSLATPTAIGLFDRAIRWATRSNMPPVVEAGMPITTPVHAATSLAGTASDDGLPAPPALTYEWSVDTAPPGASVSFANPNSASTTATFPVLGDYVLRLTASDGVASGSDTVAVSAIGAGATNQAPIVSAGQDITTDACEVNLPASVVDDGLPEPSTISVQWTAPVNAWLDDPTYVTPTAFLSGPGTYVFDIEASDGALSATDSITVTVSDSTNNQAPSVSAGVDEVVDMADGAILTAIGADDGQPCGSALVYSWKRVGGPVGAASLTTPSLRSTRVAFTSPGTFVFRVTASDGAGLAATDDVVVVALPTNLGGLTALLIGDPANVPADEVTRQRLVNLGLSVQVATAQAAQGLVAGKAVVVLSASAGTVGVAGLSDSPVPIVTWSPDAYGLLALTGPAGFGTSVLGTAQVDAPDHPLSAGIDSTTVLVSPAATLAWGIPVSGAAIVASEPGQPGRATLFGFDVGGPGPERRVGVPLSPGAPGVTASGQALFDAAVLWAMGGDADGDGLDRRQELQIGTDPADDDTNDDGVPDGAAVSLGLSPTNMDMDGDGVANATEIVNGTDPFRADTDGDSVSDATDAFPLDPTRSQPPASNPNDQTPPNITLSEPPDAVLTGSTP